MNPIHNDNGGVVDNDDGVVDNDDNVDDDDDVGYGVDDSAAQLDVGKLPEGGAR